MYTPISIRQFNLPIRFVGKQVEQPLNSKSIRIFAIYISGVFNFQMGNLIDLEYWGMYKDLTEAHYRFISLDTKQP